MMTDQQVDRLRDGLEYITEHPDEWNQVCWHRCLAGHIMRRAGVLVPPSRRFNRDKLAELLDGNQIELEPLQVGAALLGLRYRDANELFEAPTHWRICGTSRGG